MKQRILRQILLALLFAEFIGLNVKSAYSYPSFIGYGYKSCLTCHYDPFGNGPLTDYGRALSASAIAARPFFVEDKVSDEQLAAASGFLGPVELPSWIRPSIGYRGLYYTTGIQRTAHSQWINMQLDGSLALQFLDGKLVAVGSLGYIPPTGTDTSKTDTFSLTSRQQYLGYRLTKAWGIYIGLMDIAYGIRVPDHILFSRTVTFLDQNDQAHGILIHTIQKSWEAGLHIFVGNLFQRPEVRLQGISGIFEYDVSTEFRPGLSMMVSANQFRKRIQGAIHTRVKVGEGSSLLAETGIVSEKDIDTTSSDNHYLMLQTMSRIGRGLNLLMTFDYDGSPLFGSVTRYFRFGPGLQFYPMQRIELRMDFQASRSLGGTSVNPDLFNLMTQLHLWL